MSAAGAYEVTRLRNGVQVASVTMPHLRGVTVGLWAAVGGRHERKRECGVAHFLEHLLFKGTSRHSARELTLSVEGVGGYLNAYTTEDHTCYYAKAAAAHFPRLSEVLTEMYTDSQCAPEEVEREREVIREEILSCRDVPSQWAEELLSEALWPGHPLGRPLAGTAESIARIGRPGLLAFRDRCYTGRNTLVTVAGPVSHAEVVEEVGGVLGRLAPGRGLVEEPVSRRLRQGICVEKAESGQSHLAMGFHACGRRSPRRFALRLLSVVLGENMSSRLFQSLRERHGFCYSVQTSTVLLRETGSFSIFADLDSGKLGRAMAVIGKELLRLRERPVSRAELQRAQEYLIGQTRVSLDSATQQISWMGESLMAHGRVVSAGEVERGILAVSAEQIQAEARLCFRQERMGAALVGPGHDREGFERMLLF
jgi:predicted Zn-dependent peptidase